jgi:hypothetical protein
MQDASSLSGCLRFNVMSPESIAEQFKRRGLTVVLPDGKEINLKVNSSQESTDSKNTKLKLDCTVI